MNIITRHWMNPDILIHDHDIETGKLLHSYDFSEFSGLIDRWKAILIEKYDVKPGQAISVVMGPNVRYYALLFACMELAMPFIVDWPHCYSENDLTLPKLQMFGHFEYVYQARFHYDPSHPRHVPWEVKRDKMYTNHTIFQEEFFEYELKDPTLVSKMADVIWATPESTFLITSSSGTTGFPKRIEMNHHKMYLMSDRMGRKLFVPGDSVLHTTNLHHGAACGHHFLPGFRYGKEQFTLHHTLATYDVIKFVIENKINQVFRYTSDLLAEFLQEMPRVDYRLQLTTLFQITPPCVSLIKEKNVHYAQSLFGGNEIGIGMFFKRVDQSTDSETYDVRNMGPAESDFWDIELRDGDLWLKSDLIPQEWRTSNDRFELNEKGEFIFLGRANEYRIWGEWFKLRDLESKTRELFGAGANIVPDPDNQQIYLAIWEENPTAEKALAQWFEDNYNKIHITFVLRGHDRDEFFNSRKTDNSKIRYVCRNLIHQQQEKK